MAEDFWGLNLNLDDFERLLKKDDLVEEPVPIPVFVRDKKYLGLERDLSEKQLEIAKRITQILKPETLCSYMGEEKGLEYYKNYTVNEVVCMLGKGSGKDHTSRISMAYIVYLLHCLNDPIDYFGKAHGVTIDLLNLAVNAQQAKNVFFDPFKKLLLASPFFNEKGFEPRVSEIQFFDRPIRCFSGHSESEGWEGYEVLLVVLDEIAAFKGLGPNVPVLTPKGWVKNKDLRVGDYVIGADGRATSIRGIFPMGSKDVYEVTFEDGSKTQCSPDHLWTVREYSDGRRPSVKTIPLEDFKSLSLKGKYNQKRYAIPVVEPVEFDCPGDLPIHPYVLGVLIGDGSISAGTAKFTSADQEIVEMVDKNLPSGFKVVADKRKYHYRIVSGDGKTAFRYLLEEVGLWGTKSNSKFIPDIYLYASIEDRKLLLAGLMDTDGTPARGHGSYTTVSDRLKDDIVELCRGLGGIPTVSHHASWSVTDGERKDCQDKWMICPRVSFNPFMLERKAEKWKPHKRTLWRSIVDVQPLGYKEDMTCIKVANDDGLYVIDNYVVTHNTDIELKNVEHAQRAKGSASGIYNMSKVSVISRFPRVGKVVLLSFPRYKGDFITTRYKQIEDNGGEDGAWAIKAATWEVNPTISREDLEPEFKRNPVEAEARFACNPPDMEDAYFRDPQMVREAFRYADNPVQEDGSWASWFNGTDGFPRYIHVDLALKHDQAALCMVHLSGMRDVQTMVGIERLPVLNVDYIQTWKAGFNEEIPLADIRNTINLLGKKFSVAMVTFDQYASQEMMQTLRAWGYNSQQHTVRKTDYDTLLSAIYDRRLRGYWVEQLVEQELLKLKLINNTKVDHPTTGSKDIADALAGSIYMCITNLGIEQDIDIEIWDDKSVYFDDYDIEEKILPKVQPIKQLPPDLEEWLFEGI